MPHQMFIIFFLSSIGISTAISGCRYYSFTGASVNYNETQTISIKTFENYAPLSNPTLAQQFSETLRNVFLSQTQLRQVAQNGDLQIEGEIIEYAIAPVAITQADQAALNRLTITVKVRYTNTKNEKENFESTFSRFADFLANQSFSSVEQSLINDINQQLAQDIFNKTLGNW